MHKAVVVIRGDQTEPEEKEADRDPVYGNALANTWRWLKKNVQDDVFDFGVSAVREQLLLVSEEELAELNAPAPNAPVLFPAHLDCWVQTNPIPTPDPDPALFLHGPKQTGQPDVQVVFRSDVRSDWTDADIQRLWDTLYPDVSPAERAKPADEKRFDLWLAAVSACPPSSSEALPVRIADFRRWLAGLPIAETSSDVATEHDEEVDEPPSGDRLAFRWKGNTSKETVLVADPQDVFIRPGDLFVVPCSAPGVDTLGDFLTAAEPPADYAEEAFLLSRDKAVLRVPGLELGEEDEEFEARLTEAVRVRLEAEFASWPDTAKKYLRTPKQRSAVRHVTGGWVVTTKRRLGQFTPEFLDDEDSSESPVRRAITLKEHSGGVASYAKRFAAGCRLDVDLYAQAGLWHDLGKLDPRFQAMLKQSSPRTAVGEALAKSARSPRTREEREQVREVHKYPKGGRHELLSAALVAKRTDDDLLLHLIATHHGSARPFADPVVENDEVTKPFKTKLFDEAFEVPTSVQQIGEWNAELPERFWRVVRKYGWWGAAYREAVFRLADHAQSAAEQEPEGAETPDDVAPLPLRPAAEPRGLYPLPLPGLDGSNPLAFLAALGTLVVCDTLSRSTDPPNWLSGRVALSWGTAGSCNTPVLHLPDAPPAPSDFVQFLAAHLPKTVEEHPAACVIQVLEDDDHPLRLVGHIRERCLHRLPEDRPRLDWVTALICESVPEAASQLQTVRRDYLIGNFRSVMQRAQAEPLARCLLAPWDYADALDNQSLHWEPSEDRRHAYQWHQPNGDPTRKRRGGMLGANRLALEAWPLFPSFPDDRDADRVRTRGFRGNRASDTCWIWPLWSSRLTSDGVASILSLPQLQAEPPDAVSLRGFGIAVVYRSQRILVGKTPNLTPADAIA